MSATEDRLRDYLGAVADSVRPDNTRPLTDPAAPEPGPRPAPFPDGRHGWRGWAVPLAAAAGVLAIVSVSLALTGPITGGRSAGPRPTAAGPTAAGAPGYFAQTDTESGTVVGAEVRSTASGAVIARVPSPGQSVFLNVAAAPDDRTFYGAFGASPPGQYVFDKVTIESFRVSPKGKVTGPAPIAGGVLTFAPRLYPNIDALAVSPDGGQLAVLVSSLPTPQARAETSEIVVIDLRTGVRRVWQGGLNRAGFVLGVESLSWAGNGSLDFLASWCAQPDSDGACSPYQSDPTSRSQVRSLNLGADGGGLGASTVVLSEPFYAQSLVAVGAGQFDLLVPSADKKANTQPGAITVGQYSAATGKLERVLYREGRPGDGLSIMSSLTSDPSGRFLLLHLSMGGAGRAGFSGVGWIYDGAFRTLDTSGDVTPPATGW